MKKTFKFDYDYENDSLFLYNPKTKAKGSIEIDDLIVDFDNKRQVCSLEMLGASKYFHDLGIERKVTKETLKDMLKAEIEATMKQNFILIKFKIYFKHEEPISSPIVVPTLSRPSPALA